VPDMAIAISLRMHAAIAIQAAVTP